MSADNYILVKENKKNFKVMEICASTGNQLGKATRVQGLRNAVEEAMRQNDHMVEYGITFSLLEK